MPQPQTTIIFDWNGTLLDDTRAMLVATNYSLKKADLPAINMAKLRNAYSVPLRGMYVNFGLPELNSEKTIVPVIDDLLHAYRPLEPKIALRTGAKAMLTQLQTFNASVIVLSNHFESNIRSLLAQHGLTSLVTDVIANPDRTDDGYIFVPKGKRLENYIAAHNLNPRNMIIIGDSVEEPDIARKLDLTSIAITGGYTSKSRLEAVRPNHLISTLKNLVPLLQGHNLLAKPLTLGGSA